MSCEDTIKFLGFGAQVAGALGSSVTSYQASDATRTGFEHQAVILRNNQQLAEWQAQDALIRGRREQNRIQLAGRNLEGKQRAVIASRNIAANEGSAARVLADTRFMTARDAAIAGDNSEKDAWALFNQARNYGANAALLEYRARAESPVTAAASTALTSLARVAPQWYALTRNSGQTSSDPYDTNGRDY